MRTVTKLASRCSNDSRNSAIAKVGESAVKTLPMVNSDRTLQKSGLCHAQLAVKAPSTGADGEHYTKDRHKPKADVVGM